MICARQSRPTGRSELLIRIVDRSPRGSRPSSSKVAEEATGARLVRSPDSFVVRSAARGAAVVGPRGRGARPRLRRVEPSRWGAQALARRPTQRHGKALPRSAPASFGALGYPKSGGRRRAPRSGGGGAPVTRVLAERPTTGGRIAFGWRMSLILNPDSPLELTRSAPIRPVRSELVQWHRPPISPDLRVVARSAARRPPTRAQRQIETTAIGGHGTRAPIRLLFELPLGQRGEPYGVGALRAQRGLFVANFIRPGSTRTARVRRSPSWSSRKNRSRKSAAWGCYRTDARVGLGGKRLSMLATSDPQST